MKILAEPENGGLGFEGGHFHVGHRFNTGSGPKQDNALIEAQ